MIQSIDFGFLFSRVIHAYKMNPVEILKLPVKTFWLLHKNIDRINAEQDIRTATILCNVQSSEGVQDLFKSLNKQLGKVVVFNEEKLALHEANQERDRIGLMELKSISQRRR